MDRNMTHIAPAVGLGVGMPFDALTQAMVRSLFDYNPSTGDLTLKSTGKPAIRGGHLYVVIGTTRHAAAKVIWLWFYGEHRKTVNFRNSKRDFRAENLFVGVA